MFLNIKYFIKEYEGVSNYIGTGLITTYVKFARFLLGENYYSQIIGSFQIISTVNNILKSELSFLLLLGVFQFKENWKKVLNITLVLLIFPQITYLYCVLYLLPFTVLFLSSLDNSKFTIDKLLIFIALIMIYFVYRCPVSNFLDLNFAIPILAVIGTYYSIQEFMKSKHIFPIDLFKF